MTQEISALNEFVVKASVIKRKINDCEYLKWLTGIIPKGEIEQTADKFQILLDSATQIGIGKEVAVNLLKEEIEQKLKRLMV